MRIGGICAVHADAESARDGGPEARREKDMAESTATVIGPDTVIKGELTFNSRAKLLGTVEGEIHAKGDFEVAEGATCKASIDASKVVIDGLVEGNVTASDRVELSAKAQLRGDLVAQKLVVSEGASFIGHCKIGTGATSNGTSAEVKPQAKAESARATAGAKK